MPLLVGPHAHYVGPMKHIATFAILTLSLVGCATTDTTPIFRGAPTYPTTTAKLASGKVLTHQAGRPCATDERPEVGVSDRERTFSEWYLRSSEDQGLLATAPSFLSDPKYEGGEFQDYYRRSDLVEVYESISGNTILIVEDRSPTFARRAYILLRKICDNSWGHTELLLDAYPPSRIKDTNDPAFSGPPDYIYPDILELTDSHLRYTSRSGPIRVAFKQLQTKGHEEVLLR